MLVLLQAATEATRREISWDSGSSGSGGGSGIAICLLLVILGFIVLAVVEKRGK